MTELVEKCRKLVQKYIDLHMYTAALFWADKIVVQTDSPRDVFWLAQCMYLQKQYHRAAFLMQSRNLDKTHFLCTYLTAKCFYEANDLNESLKIINSSQLNTILSSGTFTPNISEVELVLFDDTPKSQAISSFLLLKGRILEAMDNRGLASDCYKQALHCDVFCYEAFDLLIKYQMLNASEERALLLSIPIADQCSPDEVDILRNLYAMKMKKYHTPTAPLNREGLILLTDNKLASSTPGCIKSLPPSPSLHVSPCSISTPMVANNKVKKASDKMQVDATDYWDLGKFQDSLDLKVSQAEILYYNCDYQNCVALTESILKKDPYHDGCLPIHISCLVELKQTTNLFSLAHSLVDLYPNMAISWFAVGCYYYVIGKSDPARGYLAKATCLDKLFGPAWLVYGHSFASENEHDQAMAAYFKASQLMKGCHLPHLYIGLECGLTNNVWLAEKFFQQAQAIAPEDPFILHERGVICFQNEEHQKAEQFFVEALDKIKRVRRGPIPSRWATLWNNLGHARRKLKKLDEALECHNEALVLEPRKSSTISAIAYVHVLKGNYSNAIHWFHKALSLKRDDSFSTTMLNYIIELWAEEMPAYEGCPDGIPKFEPPPHNSSTDQSVPSTNSIQDMSQEINETQHDTFEMNIEM
ncbi:cell division cycle protein 16 homolog [Dendroctonus ponderosae]|uniref:cell division cycle protein 16 homolog n=1 Tax=Dendroctonus ponderosae TaxID=77166 RepID=UPI002034AE80|nr:cell division cycle protein 16 homolog [Dendroctonus ponderosae]